MYNLSVSIYEVRVLYRSNYLKYVSVIGNETIEFYLCIFYTQIFV